MQMIDRRQLGLILSSIALTASFAQADIYQWEWVDPNDHSLGKRQSNVLCQDGAGADPTEYMNLFGRDLTRGYLFGVTFPLSIDGANFQDAYMRNATLDRISLMGTDMRDADLSGASFVDVFLNGYSHMERANFTDANLTDTFFRYSYLNEVNFTRADLTAVTFEATNLTGAVFTDAVITGTRFTYARNGFTQQQLYSTRSYREGNLRGTRLPTFADLRAWNFNNIDLSNGVFENTDISNASFHNARLDHTSFNGSNVIGTDFRGAIDLTDNLYLADRAILPDGTLQIVEGGGVRVRNFRGEIGIHITGSVSDGGFEVVFDDQPWISTISFAPGIPVELGSTLSLGFEDGIDPAGMIGRSFRVFDWSDVDPVGQFDIAMNGLTWDTSRLYTDGVVTLTAVPEPGTVCIASVGFSILALRRRRQFRNAIR